MCFAYTWKRGGPWLSFSLTHRNKTENSERTIPLGKQSRKSDKKSWTLDFFPCDLLINSCCACGERKTGVVYPHTTHPNISQGMFSLV